MVNFGRTSMATGSRLQVSSSSYGNANKWGAGRGNAGRGSRQRGRWNGGFGGGFGRKQKQPDHNYPSQPSKTLASVIKYQKKKGIIPGRYISDSNAAELRKQFPVSSGTQHRAKENPGPNIPPHMKLKLDDDYRHPTSARFARPSTAPRFGMKMLQKMGWSPGKGLGKYEEGTVEPVIPDGLYAKEYQPKKEPMEVIEDMSAKHPVMALTELCTRHKWPAPKFEVVDHAGPDHKKSFLMKVIVNGQAFQPKEVAPSKKQAKAEAAALFLESLGLYDRKKAPKWSS